MMCTAIHYPFVALYALGLVAVAHAVLGEQVAGMGRVVFELPAEPGHVEPQVVGAVLQLRVIASDQDPGRAGARIRPADFRTLERQALARPLLKKLDHDPIIAFAAVTAR
jgi:hypothetical protein